MLGIITLCRFPSALLETAVHTEINNLTSKLTFSGVQPTVPDSDKGSLALYSVVLNETARQPIPVPQFSEYMSRVKAGEFARLKQEYQVGKQNLFLIIY